MLPGDPFLFSGTDLLQHLSPLGWHHINLTGDYLWTDPAAPSSALRPLRQLHAVEAQAKPSRISGSVLCPEPTRADARSCLLPRLEDVQQVTGVAGQANGGRPQQPVAGTERADPALYLRR